MFFFWLPPKTFRIPLQRHSCKGNVAQIYELRRTIKTEVQGDRLTLQYFIALDTLWKRFNHLQTYHSVCSSNVANFKTYIESERIFKFPAGLKPELDAVRSQILGMEPVTTLGEAFAHVQNEESPRSV